MWGRKYSLFPEHLISLYLWGVHDFTHSLYILLNLSVLRLCLWITDYGLFAWISLTAMSRTYIKILKVGFLVGLFGGTGWPNKNNTKSMSNIHNKLNTCISSKCKSLLQIINYDFCDVIMVE